MQAKRRSSQAEKEVSRRIRMRRMQLRISQAELANELGVSFQQVQKYEYGANRISAGRLQQIAEYFNVPVSFFFGPVSGAGKRNRRISGLLDSAYALRLSQAFSRIQDKKLQLAILTLVELTAEGEQAD
jgi:transcriptional regulator with XRE-family HTH domain